jgi:hypothetical protein
MTGQVISSLTPPDPAPMRPRRAAPEIRRRSSPIPSSAHPSSRRRRHRRCAKPWRRGSDGVSSFVDLAVGCGKRQRPQPPLWRWWPGSTAAGGLRDPFCDALDGGAAARAPIWALWAWMGYGLPPAVI